MGAYPFYVVVDKRTEEVVSVHLTRREAKRSTAEWWHRVRGVHADVARPPSTALRERLFRRNP